MEAAGGLHLRRVGSLELYHKDATIHTEYYRQSRVGMNKLHPGGNVGPIKLFNLENFKR